MVFTEIASLLLGFGVRSSYIPLFLYPLCLINTFVEYLMVAILGSESVNEEIYLIVMISVTPFIIMEPICVSRSGIYNIND